MIVEYLIKPIWKAFYEFSGLRLHYCKKRHQKFHSKPRQVFYDGSCIIWCEKCREGFWRT